MSVPSPPPAQPAARIKKVSRLVSSPTSSMNRWAAWTINSSLPWLSKFAMIAGVSITSYSPTEGETFVIVNPGQGVNGTVSGYCNFLYGQGSSSCLAGPNGYPPNQNPQAARSYDGVEVRLTKALSHNWYGLFSYTYSHFRGNYTGLTSSDLSDGGSGGLTSNTTQMAVLQVVCCQRIVPTRLSSMGTTN